jgi:hypothetical protein
MNARLFLALSPALFLIALALFPAQASEGDFTGPWRIQTASQEQAEKALRKAQRSLRRGQGQSVLRALVLPETTLNLAIEGPEVRFHFDGKSRPTLYTDGRPSVIDAQNPILRFAAWEGDVLYVERTNNSGTRIEEQWRLIAPTAPREGAAAPPGPWLEAQITVRNALLEEPLTLRLIAERPAAQP